MECSIKGQKEASALKMIRCPTQSSASFSGEAETAATNDSSVICLGLWNVSVISFVLEESKWTCMAESCVYSFAWLLHANVSIRLWAVPTVNWYERYEIENTEETKVSQVIRVQLEGDFIEMILSERNNPASQSQQRLDSVEGLDWDAAAWGWSHLRAVHVCVGVCARLCHYSLSAITTHPDLSILL